VLLDQWVLLVLKGVKDPVDLRETMDLQDLTDRLGHQDQLDQKAVQDPQDLQDPKEMRDLLGSLVLKVRVDLQALLVRLEEVDPPDL